METVDRSHGSHTALKHRVTRRGRDQHLWCPVKRTKSR